MISSCTCRTPIGSTLPFECPVHGSIPGPINDRFSPGAIIEFDPAKGWPITFTPEIKAPEGMTPEQFVFWLQGMAFMGQEPSPQVWQAICRALKTVKVKPGEQNAG